MNRHRSLVTPALGALVALLGASTVAMARQDEAAASAGASATVVAAIGIITNTADLDFGSVVASASGAGTVELTAAASPARTGTGVTLGSAMGVSAATFSVTGEGGASYVITFSPTRVTITRTNATDEMTITDFTSSGGAVTLGAAGAPAAPAGEEAAFRARRLELARAIAASGVRDSATLAAMRAVPRHEFVRARYRAQAYEDHPLPTDLGQTISQPSLVALMTEMLHARPGMKVLEVGTGSGYQAALLAHIGCRVFTIEILKPLADSARERLRRLGYGGVTVRAGDGYLGWPEEAPFDAVVVTAGAPHVPPELVRQLRPGGCMVIPVDNAGGYQDLLLLEKDARGTVRTQKLLPVEFVPLVRGRR